MGEVVALNSNGQSHIPPQVYECGVEPCQNQNWRLMPDGHIQCGVCSTPSAFMHYEPEHLRPGENKLMMKLLESRTDRLDNYVCPRCRHNHFHLHASGTITCFRCRHSVPYKHWNPEEASA